MPPPRHRLALYEEGGVLFDLETGRAQRLDFQTSHICSNLFLGGTVEQAREMLHYSYHLDGEPLEAALASVLALLADDTAPRPRGAFALGRGDAGERLLLEGGVPLVRLECTQRQVTLRGPLDAATSTKVALQRALPYALHLVGFQALRASAALVQGVLTLFLGPEGSGKTTCARAFAERGGGHIVADDFAVLGPLLGEPSVYSNEALLRWVDERANDLAGDRGVTLDVPSFVALLPQPPLAIAEVLVLDAARRGGTEVVVETLNRPDALLAILESGFGEIPERRIRDFALALGREFAERTRVRRATVPAELEALGPALRRYRVRTAHEPPMDLPPRKPDRP